MLESTETNFISNLVDSQKTKRNLEGLKPKEDEFEKTVIVKKEIWEKIKEYTDLVKLSSSI